MADRCEYGNAHLGGPCAYCERNDLRAEVERLRVELDLMRGRAERAEAACSDAASRLAQWMPAHTDAKKEAGDE